MHIDFKGNELNNNYVIQLLEKNEIDEKSKKNNIRWSDDLRTHFG